MLFAEICNEWWPMYKLMLAPSTIHNREMYMRVHIIPYMGDIDIRKITTRDIYDYVSLKKQSGSPLRHPTGLSASTIWHHFCLINQVFNYALEQGLIEQNPCSGIKIPKRDYREIKVFKDTEISLLIKAARPKWLGDAILLSYRTGMRRGEVFGLKWDDINTRGGFLTVRRSVHATSPHEMSIRQPKTKRSLRRILLDDATIDMINRRRDKAKAKTEYVFENQYGELINPWYVTKYMRKANDRAGIPHRSFHALRHTHATILLEKGVHPKIVQERLGHSNISMTLDIYSHMLPTMQSVVVDVFNLI